MTTSNSITNGLIQQNLLLVPNNRTKPKQQEPQHFPASKEGADTISTHGLVLALTATRTTIKFWGRSSALSGSVCRLNRCLFFLCFPNQQMFRIFVEEGPDMMSIHGLDHQAQFRYASSTFQRVAGINPRDVLGKALTDLVVTEDHVVVQEALLKVRTTGDTDGASTRV